MEVLIQLLSYNVVSKHKNKSENTEYHGMFISFKSHMSSKQGSMEFSIISSCLIERQSFSDNS